MCIESLVSNDERSIKMKSILIVYFSSGGGTCYDLVNAFVCFCPDRVFRPQCNATAISGSRPRNHTSVLIASSQCK